MTSNPTQYESNWLTDNGWIVTTNRDGDWRATATNGSATVTASAISKSQAVGECYRKARYGDG